MTDSGDDDDFCFDQESGSCCGRYGSWCSNRAAIRKHKDELSARDLVNIDPNWTEGKGAEERIDEQRNRGNA